jgi:hypothetical protein
MNIIYWIIGSLLLMINFNLWGFLIAVALMVVTDYFVVFFMVRQELRTNEVKENNVLVTIEIVEHSGENMFLVYNALTKKFVLQGLSFDEIKNSLIKKYEGKNIFVRNEKSIDPIYIANNVNSA